ncbi:importin-11 isoform X2 [Dendrobium catenatum]|uniref:importin-11 isoform X2 n=1 Tax=Dendrobium catenatum TaxID=906689 RepID=UPI0010A05A86|nr:importin-11 isoform X2 [Dendrobium catenatum]
MALSASDVETVYSLLSDAFSPDLSVRRPAESALAQCERRPGFCSCLLEIIAARDVACRDDVRLLAAVFFKNSIRRFWRQRVISNDEKAHLRKKLLLNIREESSQIALQLADLISKIARIDYPKEWPELFSLLAQQLQSADILASHRVFMVLFRTLKELSTKRLSADQRTFSEVAALLFDYTWNLWKSDVQTILQSFSCLAQCDSSNSLMEHQNDLLLTCERWLFCTKIIRQLIISGNASDATSAQEVRPIKEVCPVLLSVIQSFLPYCTSFMEKQPEFWNFTKRACIKLMKVLAAFQRRHPYSFGDNNVLPPILVFCLNEIINPEQAVPLFNEFLIQCMILIKSTIECKEYKPSLTGRVINESGDALEQRKKIISRAVFDMLAAVFPNDRVVLLCNILIRRYFIYTSEDLNEWFQNSESFHHEQDMLQWTEKLRPCAEALYIVLFENYRPLLAPVVVSILKEAMSASPPLESEITPAMLLKDAAYSAAGHVYYELSAYLNFSDWFNRSLSLELSNNHPNMLIIHRKIALILGQWVSEIKGDTRKLVYHALIKLLQDNDIAVRLAACRSLCYLVQDSNSSEQEFFDLLSTCWTFCFKLVEEVQELDSKVQVLNLISLLTEHLGEKITPFAGQLVNFFGKMWEESIGESLLQIQLLEALRNFVCSLGYQSCVCYNMLLPILQKGINVDDPDALNLLEDSIRLWEAVLSHATSIVPQLLDLFPSLVTIVERSFDHLQVVVDIIEDYIIFGGAEFLNCHSSSVAKLLDGIVGNVNDKGLLSIIPTLDILIQCFPLEAPPLISAVLQKLILLCLSGEDDRNPSRTAVRTSSGAILARLLVMNTNYLGHLASEPSLIVALQQAGLSINQNVLLCLVDLWIDKIDNTTCIQRKTYASALSIILTLRLPEVIDKIDEILSVCTTVILGGTEDSSKEDSSGDAASSSWPSNESLGYYNGVPSKELRRRQSMLRDNLNTCAAFHGESSFHEAMSRMHPSAFAQLQQALKMA